jgi:hypothetical protein
MPAPPVDTTTASLLPAVIGMVPRVSTTKPNGGCPAHSSSSSQARPSCSPSPCLRRCAPAVAHPSLAYQAMGKASSEALTRRAKAPRVLGTTLPGVAFPPVGPVDLSSPPSQVLCSAQTASLPISGHFACRSCPNTLPVSVCSWCPSRARDLVDPPPRQGLWSPGPPRRECDKETDGSPTFPSSPCEDMPRSSTPVVSCVLALPHPGLLPSGHWKPSAFLSVPP